MRYRKRQIQHVIDKSRHSSFKPSIKIVCEEVQTKYLDITCEELLQIQELLQKDIN